jgi:hypothetical protein
MKALFYFISFYLFLFGLGNNLSCSAQQLQPNRINTTVFHKNQYQQFKTKEYSLTVIEFTDIEIEEELHNEDNNLNSSSPILLTDYSLTNSLLGFTSIFVAYCNANYNPTNVSLGLLSSPLYLKNSVFRI